MSGFVELQIHGKFVEQLQRQGITQPTEIQQLAIPVIRSKQDAVIQSTTGSGKTLAYVLPALEQIDIISKQLQVMIIAPTRELTMQIIEEVNKLTSHGAIRSQALIGGAAVGRQIDKLKLHPHLIVGTPGRITELIKIKKINVTSLKLMVIDEVDQVFELSSMNEMNFLLSARLKSSQLVFVSATIPAQMNHLIASWMKQPVPVKASSSAHTLVASSIEHQYVRCEQREKIDTLRKIMRLLEPKSAIVFVNEIEDIAEIVGKMKFVGLSIEAISGEASKQERALTMKNFRENKFQLLLATDIASRGLDIPDITLIIHLDPATNADHYLHRVGRTGRMGRAGTSISIVSPKEQFILEKFEKTLGIQMTEKEMSHGNWVDASQSSSKQRNQSSIMQRNQSPSDGQNKKQVTPVPVDKENGFVKSSRTSYEKRPTQENLAPESNRALKTKKRKVLTAKEMKNKGAPRWLKAKSDQT